MRPKQIFVKRQLWMDRRTSLNVAFGWKADLAATDAFNQKNTITEAVVVDACAAENLPGKDRFVVVRQRLVVDELTRDGHPLSFKLEKIREIRVRGPAANAMRSFPSLL